MQSSTWLLGRLGKSESCCGVHDSESSVYPILRIADNVGFFDVEISDEMLKSAFSEMIEAARAPVAKAAK